MDQEELQERLWPIFLPTIATEAMRVREKGTRFVHYTSAESAFAILRSGRMLLRNATLMNDFSEVQHGLHCLGHAYNGSGAGERLKTFLRSMQQDLPEILEATFNETEFDLRGETYLISISEHGDGEEGDSFEDALGRLSMWRAYAPKDGVALVFNNAPFLTESNALNAYSCPVTYASVEDYVRVFSTLVEGIEREADFLRNVVGPQGVLQNLVNTFRFATVSTKHPSFREEREWRVIYSPTLLERQGLMTQEQTEKIPTEVMCLRGVPQRVYSIPFQNHPDEGFVGATIPELFDRVLIGPTSDAYAIGNAMVAELKRCGVTDADARVFITGIPLRHS